MSDIQSTLEQLKTTYNEISPKWLESKWRNFDPATDEQIAALEAELGFALDLELREFFATCDFKITTDGNYGYEGFEKSASDWRMLTGLLEDGTFDQRFHDRVEESGGKLEKTYWHRAWVPFVVDGCGNTICVDHDPGPNGTKGQVLMMETQDGMGPFASPFDSLNAYLGHQLSLLQNGKYRVDEEGFIEIDQYM